MCGITGIINYCNLYTPDEKIKTSLNHIQAMTNAISHRGRDGHGFFNDDQGICFLGHRRLSILDLSNNASQPMYSYDRRYVIIFNGEIYNFKELKVILENEGFVFKTTSDTEVLLNSYIYWGQSCLQKLRGIFSFAIWDDASKKLFAARDHLGVKPFYWFYSKKGREKVFVFASELKAILKLGFVEKKIDLYALEKYLSFYSVPNPLTLIKDVFQLRPGHFIELSDKEFIYKKYWNLQDIQVDEKFFDKEYAKTKIQQKLSESVCLQMRSDVSVGAFLSGGLDSSLIVGLMKKFTDKKISTFTIGFGKEGGYLDESSIAKRVAKKFDCNHFELMIGADFFRKNLNEFIYAIDQPSGDGINSFCVSKLASEHVKVALSGIGGDELFLGYRYFQDVLKIRELQSKFGGGNFLNLFAHLHDSAKIFRSIFYRLGIDFFKFGSVGPEQLYMLQRRLFRQKEVEKILAFPQSKNLEKECPGLSNLNCTNIFDDLNVFSRLELSFYASNMLLRDMDATSMFSTLEVRVPFLDHEFTELMLRVTADLKLYKNSKNNKPLLVDCFNNLLPQSVMGLEKKGFEMPVGFWLLRFFKNDLDNLENIWWLDKDEIRKILKNFYRNPKNYLKLWTIFVLSRWIEEYNVEFEYEAKNFGYRSCLYSPYK